MATVLSKYNEIDELGGGRFHLEQHLRPITFERNGYPRRITDVLANSGAQDLTIGVDELVQFRLRDKLSGNAPLVHFGAGNSHVRFTPLNTNNVDAVVQGNTITFVGAWNGADLRLAIGGHILRKDILLKTGHPKSFSFRLDEHAGLNLVTLETPEFRILPPVLIAPTGLLSVPLKWVQTTQGGKTVLTVTLPVGDFTGWTLDPTLTLQPSGTSDIYVYGANANYASSRLTASAIDATTFLQVGQTLYESFYYPARAFLKFDTSSIGATGTVTQVNLALTPTVDSSTTDFDVQIVKYGWSGTDPITAGNMETAYDGVLAADLDDAIWRNTSGISINTEYTSGNLNTAWINKTGTTYYGLMNSRDRAATTSTGLEELRVASSDNATAAYRPKLSIIYSLPSFIPGIMRHHFIPSLGVN